MARIKCEQETTITFNEAEADMLVWSASPRFQMGMEQLGIEPFKIDQGHIGADGSGASCWYRIPKKWLRIRPRRKVSEAERARLRAQGFQKSQDRGRQKRSLHRRTKERARSP
jgi:hypothetical protein